MSDNVIEIDNVSKEYKLGEIGGGTLRGDLQSWWARVRHREDPNLMIGTDTEAFGSSFYALKDISFSVKKGEAVGIIGHNGAGKSTLLKLLSRVTGPSSGEIRLKGRIASMLEVGTGFHPELTGRENIYMNGAILGMSRKEVDSKIEEIIDFSECRQFIDTPVKRYSSGMYVKLAFAVAAHLDAEIMVMDEVLAVGDMKFQKKCLGKMGDEAQGGKTVLYVSHNMSTIRQLCSRCIVLNHGKVIFDGDVEKAIALYMQQGDIGLKQVFDIAGSKRAKDMGQRARLERVEILNSIPLEFRDRLSFRLSIGSVKEDIRAAQLRTIFTTIEGAQVAVTMSSSFNISKGEVFEKEFDVDTSVLAPGIYQVDLVLFQMDEHAHQTMLDGTLGMQFEIVENIERLWNFKWFNKWGNAVLEEISVADVNGIKDIK